MPALPASNFAFLLPEWPDLHASAVRVEQMALVDPRGAAFYARRTLEIAVKWMYQSDLTLNLPYDATLSALLHEPTFRAFVPRELWLKMRLLKDLGNEAVHSNRTIEERDGLVVTRELFHVLYWLVRTYTQGEVSGLDGLVFDITALSVEARQAAHTAAQLRHVQTQISDRDKAVADALAANLQSAQTAAELDAQIKALQAEVAQAKRDNAAQPDNHDYSEKETRDYFIDLLLREAGWPLKNREDREFEVSGMPNNKGVGFVDYVLWGDDGLPLAVVEAKRTRKDARVGKRQAELYADCLQARYNRRPLIFFTNGYIHYFWDDARGYPPREIQGFFKKDEMELLIQRRTTQKALGEVAISGQIVERHYQTSAIRAVSEHLEKKERRALLVMATGAGKTRTVIALSDLLQRAGWAKRVLFLADRVALVNQAANAFKTFLSGSSPMNLVTEKDESGAASGSRILLSTYPTMMGLIDEAKGDGSRRFGPGHFDLIVIDEAHRSVYQKYGAIFGYFDSLLVGLTATPKSDVDKNTYGLFELENGVPTYAYELKEAVADGFLVPPRAVSVPLKFQREGIKYDDLTEDEKDEWDAKEWGDEADAPPDKVEAGAVNKWLFNTDTVDKVLEHLMKNGQKVDGGDRLGKTIIFAKNHQHALFIEERFNKNYPHLAGKFARVIDNYESYAQSLLDDFSTPDKNPHIAISVDMLDTGIDVPQVVNLVFFKLIRSKTKFFQMLGRGTRLCPNLFGPGADKEYFTVFDYCGNLEFFGENPLGVTATGGQESLSKKLFLRRLELLQKLRSAEGEATNAASDRTRETKAPYNALDTDVADTLHAEVEAMNLDNFLVRPARKLVEEYKQRQAWEAINPESAHEVGETLAGLPSELDPDDLEARQFDLLMLNLQIGLLKSSKAFPKGQKQVREIAGQLEERVSIPLVAAQMPLILELQTDDWWQDVTPANLEAVRKRLRDLVKFLDKSQRSMVYTDFEDELGETSEVTFPELGSSIDTAQYRKKVTQYLREHLDNSVVKKLRDNVPVEKGELVRLESVLYALGGEDGAALFASITQGKPIGGFIRGLVGLDREAAKAAFGTYLTNSQFNTSQISFINEIIDYLTQNGVMEPARLYEQPFTRFSMQGLDGIFSDMDAERIMGVVRTINANAEGILSVAAA